MLYDLVENVKLRAYVQFFNWKITLAILAILLAMLAILLVPKAYKNVVKHERSYQYHI